MAFKNGLSEHLDELRLASPRSPPSESPFSSFPSPPGTQQGFMSAFQSPAQDTRANMQRRFTTDSAKLSSWAGFSGQTAPPLPESVDLLTSFEKKRQHIEYMREQRKRFEADLKLLDLQQEKEKKEMDQLARDLAQTGVSGPVSEPTTPPEHHDAGFPSMFSRPSRFSMSSTTPSSSMFSNMFSSQNTTPPSSQLKSAWGSTSNHNESAPESVMTSRRNSEQESNPQPSSTRRSGHTVRYSMPASNIRTGLNGMGSNTNGFMNTMDLNSFFSSKSSYEDNQEDKHKEEERMSTPDVKSYLRMTDIDDKFPTLVRQGDNSGMLSANPAAIDLANSRTPVPEAYGGNARHATHQSLPQNNLNWSQGGSAEKQGAVSSSTASGGYPAPRHANRVSLESAFPNFSNAGQTFQQHTNGVQHNRPNSLHMSYSTNDVPTAHNVGGYQKTITPPKSSNDQVQHGHSYSTSYVPSTPHSSHSLSGSTPPTPQSCDQEDRFGQQQSHTTAFNNGASFGPQLASGNHKPKGNEPIPPGANNYPSQFYGFGIQQFPGAPLPVNGNQVQSFTPHGSFGPYGSQAYASYPRFPENSRNSGQGRRNGDTDSNAFSRFSNVPIGNYRGELYSLCKDQHGCRYLQRKLEERVPENVQMIFLETNMHVVELMTDPFGNYLCQKLLEFSNDEQRTTLIKNAAPQLVQIAFNQHGTRALQKMIEFISTSEQTQMVIEALQGKVVELVQDLNGNHVIQKCLNRLSATDAQFIYNAVGASCVTVGTHRHGCCVLQRCIDHASGDQRARLISQITGNAFSLVQDPFGNYVVQYILDLSEPHFTDPLCKAFVGNIPALSKQKFSSNVIEKCIRTADIQIRRLLIQEMMTVNELERMLRDSFANYVVQTAIDFADPETRTKLMDAVRPILPSIRQTPHGRRIAGKMVSLEAQNRANGAITTGQLTPNGLAGDENGIYPPTHSFPSNTAQFAPQFTFPGDMTNQTTSSCSESASSTTATDDASTVIFSPIPHHGNNAINGINAANVSNFSLY